MQEEGVDKALDIFRTSGDSQKAIEAFNNVKNSKVKVPEGVFLEMEKFEINGGPMEKIVGYKVENGKKVKAFDETLLAMARAGTKGRMALLEKQITEGGANQRNNATIAARESGGAGGTKPSAVPTVSPSVAKAISAADEMMQQSNNLKR
jgi:hypothetical protein